LTTQLGTVWLALAMLERSSMADLTMVLVTDDPVAPA